MQGKSGLEKHLQIKEFISCSSRKWIVRFYFCLNPPILLKIGKKKKVPKIWSKFVSIRIVVTSKIWTHMLLAIYESYPYHIDSLLLPHTINMITLAQVVSMSFSLYQTSFDLLFTGSGFIIPITKIVKIANNIKHHQKRILHLCL